VLDVTGYLEIY